MAYMDTSYITHQRRFALIPQSTTLSAEDEQAIRIRTGDVIPTIGSHYNQTDQEKLIPSSHLTIPPGDHYSTKRKASTTAEEYQAIVSNSQDATAEGERRNSPGDLSSTTGKAMVEDLQDVFQHAEAMYGKRNGYQEGQVIEDCGTTSSCGASPKTVAATLV